MHSDGDQFLIVVSTNLISTHMSVSATSSAGVGCGECAAGPLLARCTKSALLCRCTAEELRRKLTACTELGSVLQEAWSLANRGTPACQCLIFVT
jgi:hypothetical protein